MGEFSFISAVKSGFAIYALDVALRPQLGEGAMAMMRFYLEGLAVYYLKNMEDCECAPAAAPSASAAVGDSISYDDFVFGEPTIIAATIWVSDMFLKPEMFKGFGSEILKFIIQGAIVELVCMMYETGYSKMNA